MRLYLLSLAVAAILHNGQGYVPGREYIYHYFGTIYSRFPNNKVQYSGIAFDSHVIVQHHTDFKNIKIDSFKLDTITHEVHDVENHPFVHKDVPEIDEHITKPFRINLERNHKLKSYQVNRDENIWSVNFKRGLLNFLHLDFDQTNPILVDEGHHLKQPDLHDNFYRVLEDGVGGECETLYEIRSEPYILTPYTNHVINVTKSINYKNCVRRSQEIFNNFRGFECADCEVDKREPVHSTALFDYNIKGDRHNFVIEHGKAIGEVVFAPFTHHGQTIAVFMNRTLHLIEEHDIREKLNVSPDLVTFDSLVYHHPGQHDFSKVIDLKQPHYLYDIFGFKTDVEEVKTLFHELGTFYDDKPDSKVFKDKRVLPKFTELIRAVSTLSYDDFDELFRTYADIKDEDTTEDNKVYKALFYDVLTVTGTNPAVLYGKHLINTRRMSKKYASHFIHSLPFHIKEPTEILLDEFYRMCDHPNMRHHYHLRVDCHLAFASLVYHTCEVPYHQKDTPKTDHSLCTPETAYKFFDLVVGQYATVDVEDAKNFIGFIKIIGNFGMKESITHLKPFVTGEKEYPLYFRTAAVIALKRAVFFHSEEVLKLLVPLFFNHTEDYQLRIDAFSIIMASRPSVYLMETIAASLYHEPSQPVISYVYSMFKSAINSTHPCHKKISKNVKEAWRILKSLLHFHPEITHDDTYVFLSSGYDKFHDLGGFTFFKHLANNRSFIPRSVVLSINDYMLGKTYESFAFGFNGFGLDKYIDKFFGPEGFISDVFHKKRHARDVSTTRKELKEIDDQLHITTRDYEKLFFNIFFRMFGSQITFFHVDDHNVDPDSHFDFKNIIKKINDWKGTYRHFLLGLDKLQIIPTEVGIPVVLDFKLPSFVYFKNNDLKIEVNPEPNKLQLKTHFDGHFVYDRDLTVTMGVVVPFKHKSFGAGINRRSLLSLPTKFDFDVDLNHFKHHFKWVPVVPHEVYYHEFSPFTFTKSYKDHLPITHESVFVPLFKKEVMKKYDHDVFHDFFGVGLKFKGLYNNIWNSKGAWIDFLIKKTFREKVYYFYANPHFHPYHLHVFLTADDKDKTTEVVGDFKYTWSDPDSVENRPITGFFNPKHHDDDVTQDPRKTVYHVINGEIIGKGPRERKLLTEASYLHSKDNLHHKINFLYDRTPFRHTETDNFKMCFSGRMKFPHHDLKKFFDLDVRNLEHKVHSDAHFFFGHDCGQDGKIEFKGIIEKTEEQKVLEGDRERRLTPDYHNPVAHTYQHCLEDRRHGGGFTYNCEKYMHYVSLLKKFTFDITYDKLPEHVKNFTRKAGRWVKHKFFTHMDWNDVTDQDDKWHVDANVSFFHPIWDVHITKPYEKVHYHKVYVPGIPEVTSLPKNNTDFHGFFSWKRKDWCLVEGDHVNTFDNVSFTLPSDISCYKVIAKDCSSNEEFVVLGSKLPYRKFTKALKAFIGNTKVEALPLSEDSNIIVRVDGKKVTVTEQKPYIHEGTVHNKDAKIFSIHFNGVFYSILSDLYGVEIYYDGKFISVLASKFYTGKLCGLCGDFNHDKQHEFKGPEDCVYHNVTEFAYSYTVPDDGCTVPEVKSPCGPDGQHVFGCTTLRNRYVYVGTKNRMVCFSTAPLPECTAECKEKGTITRNVGFHCLPIKDDFTRYLLRQSRERVLHEVKKKKEDHYAEVTYPETCVKLNVV